MNPLQLSIQKLMIDLLILRAPHIMWGAFLCLNMHFNMCINKEILYT